MFTDSIIEELVIKNNGETTTANLIVRKHGTSIF